MKRTIKQAPKSRKTQAKLGLLAAASVLAIGTLSSHLVAQTAGNAVYSGGYATSGIPITDDAHGKAIHPVAQNGAAAPAAERPVTARHGRWTTSVTPFVEGTVTYSDNIGLAPRGFEEDETVFSATAGVTFGAQSNRLSGSLSYAASYDHYLNDTNEDGFRHALNTGWSAAVIPNLLYLDAGGGVSEIYIDSDDRFSGNPVAGADDRSRVYYGQISPSLRRNLGGWANAELRYGLRGEAYDDDDIDGSYSHNYRVALTSDPCRFRRVGWAAVTEYEDFRRENDDGLDRTRWSSYVSLAVPVSRSVALTATAGYDDFSDDISRDDDIEGVYGNVGARFQPSERLSAQVYAGYRYGGFDYGALASYALRRNLVAALQAGRSVQFNDFGAPVAVTGAGFDGAGNPQFVSGDGGVTSDLNRALAHNLITGETGILGDPDFAIQREDAIVDSVQAQLSGSTGRTGYNLGVAGVRRDFGDIIADETVLSANLGLTRELTDRLALDLGAGYSRFDVDGTEADDFDTLILGAGLSYQLTEIINVFGRYTYTERFADDSLDEFKENAGVIGVNASF